MEGGKKEYSNTQDKVTYCREAELTIKKKDSEFKREKIATSADAAKYIKQFYHDDIEIYESFFVLMLNRRNETIAYAKIAQGGVSMVLVDVKIIAKYILDTMCSSVIVAHNHPSGTLEASKEDIALTRRIKNMCDLIDVRVLDHLILTPSGEYYSFGDKGKI